MKANLGSNTKIIPGWTNVDNDAYVVQWLGEHAPQMVKYFVLEDLNKWLKDQPDESYEAIAMIQVLDHFTFPNAFWICQQVYRVLKPGGVFRLMVEALDDIIEVWQSGPNALLRWQDGQPALFKELGDDLRLGVLLFGNLAEEERYTGHKMLYTLNGITELLQGGAGFDELHVFYGEKVSYIPDWDFEFDTQPEHSLTLEAIK